MSDLHSMAIAVRTAFDEVNPGMPPALALSSDQPNLRRYAPHPLAPTEDEELPRHEHDPRERSFEEVMEDETGKPAFGPL